jgi:hypothetical protein
MAHVQAEQSKLTKLTTRTAACHGNADEHVRPARQAARRGLLAMESSYVAPAHAHLESALGNLTPAPRNRMSASPCGLADTAHRRQEAARSTCNRGASDNAVNAREFGGVATYTSPAVRTSATSRRIVSSTGTVAYLRRLFGGRPTVLESVATASSVAAPG